MFPMTVTLHTPAQLNAVLAAMNLDDAAALPTPAVPLPKSDTAKVGKVEAEKPAQEVAEKKPDAVKEAPAPTQPTAKAGEGAAQEKKAEGSAAKGEATAPTYEQTAAAVTDLGKAKGREAAVSVLAKFSATNLKQVKPEDFAAVIAACQEAGQ